MADTSFLIARDRMELHQLMRLVSRQTNCVVCDDSTKLQCPSCSTGEVCQFTVPIDCTQCAKSVCMPDTTATSPSTSSGGSGPTAGPIAGGVIGGIAAIAIITYLVWRFLIKPKRQLSPSVYDVEEHAAPDTEKEGTLGVNRRGSTHTVHSIASTVLTRASNIIQIAYIPGVTNRATPTSPNVLVPPVPPIPMHHAQGSRDSTLDHPHFFVPGDLRGSTYTDISEVSDRTSLARTSYAPRSSIASTLYGKQAQILAPAQTGMRAKPTVVSVKGGPNAPPVPSLDYEKFDLRPESTISNFSVGSTFLNNANTATQARVHLVKLGGSGLKKVEIAYKPDANASSTTLGPTSLHSPALSGKEEGSPAADQGPFSDPPTWLNQRSPASPILGTVKEDDKDSIPRTLDAGQRGDSPFGDEHATKD